MSNVDLARECLTRVTDMFLDYLYGRVEHIRNVPKGENRSPWKRKVYLGRMPAPDVRDPRYEYTSQGVRRLG